MLPRRAFLAAGLLAACGRRKATAFSGFCFVANQDSRSIAVVDLSRFRIRKHIPLDAAPSAILAHPRATRVFALTPETGSLVEIDAASLAITRRARAGNHAVGMSLSPANDALWVLYRDPAALVEFPLDSLRPARQIRLAAPPDSFDLSSDGRAAIAIRQDRRIVLASLAGSRIERTIEAAHEPSIVAFQSDCRQLLAASQPEQSLAIFQTTTGRVVVRLPLPLEPRNFCFNADGGQLFISGAGMDAVVIVYPYRTEVAETMLAGHAPGVMEVTNRGAIDQPGYLMVANPQTDSVTVLDFDNLGKKLIAVVQVGKEPRRILVTPDRQYALVLNQKSGDLAVIRIYSLVNQGAPHRYQYPTPLFTMIPVGEKPVDAAIVSFS